MNLREFDDELAALKKHLESRGLDTADCISLFVTWLGSQCGLHARTPEEAETKAERLAGWIRQNARSVSESLRGGGHGRH